MSAIDRLSSLVADAMPADDLVGPWQRAEDMFGFVFPSTYIELIDQFGAGRWGGTLTLGGPRELLSGSLFSEGWLRRDRYQRHRRALEQRWFGSRTARTRTDVGNPPDWPLWPENGGAVSFGLLGDVDLFLLRHLRTATWAIGARPLKAGFQEINLDIADFLHSWLTGEVSITPGDNAAATGGPTFEPQPTLIVVANLEETTSPLHERVKQMSELIRRDYRVGPFWEQRIQTRSERKMLQGPQLVSPFSLFARQQADGDTAPVQYLGAPWQRLDFTLDGETISANGWYEDATDGSGRHRLCVCGDPDRAERGVDLLAELAASIQAEVTDIDHL